jgi:hypothetical protein
MTNRKFAFFQVVGWIGATITATVAVVTWLFGTFFTTKEADAGRAARDKQIAEMREELLGNFKSLDKKTDIIIEHLITRPRRFSKDDDFRVVPTERKVGKTKVEAQSVEAEQGG